MSDKKILVGDMSRETAIGILKLMLEAMEVYDSIAPTPQRRNAVQMAISSLETDEAYQLEYERTAGHWNEIPKYVDIAWMCSECGHFTTMKHNYCPNCGADMRGTEE